MNYLLVYCFYYPNRYAPCTYGGNLSPPLDGGGAGVGPLGPLVHGAVNYSIILTPPLSAELTLCA